MSLLAEPIMAFFYAETLSAEHLRIASELLSVSSLTVVLFTVVQATSSILQGLHKQRIPMYTLVAGVACKIVLNYTLVGIPQINIHGAPISSIVCYTVSMVPNLYYVLKHGQLKFNWMGWIVRPGAGGVYPAGIAAHEPAVDTGGSTGRHSGLHRDRAAGKSHHPRRFAVFPAG